MDDFLPRDVDKNDALMTRGMAILSMLILHLFCRTGSKVFGSPIIWFDAKTPFVYCFGFFAEICVFLYSIGGVWSISFWRKEKT